MRGKIIDFDAIKASVPMQTVLGHYGIAVRRSLAACPFHADKRPSMRVYHDGFYCFSCGSGGDVISFIARKEGLKNAEAAALAAQIGGIDMPDDDYRTRERMRRIAQERRKQERKREAGITQYDALCAKRRVLVRRMQDSEPFSDVWCEAAYQLPAIEGELDGLFDELSGVGLSDTRAI